MRCYFHLVNGHETILDENGVEVADLATAVEMALHAIDDLKDEALQPGGSWQGWTLDIVDPTGRILASIPLDPTIH